MDRISRALELAKTGTGAGPRPGAARQARGRPLKFEYTTTRTVPVPQHILTARRIIGGRLEARVTDAYRLLRTRVLHRMRQNRWNSLGIISAGPQEGKTLTAINLGVCIARDENHSVLLVDADLRRPSVCATFGIRCRQGLGDYLTKDIALEEILISPGIERFAILPGREGAAPNSESLASPRMTELVDDVKLRYRSRIALFDLPPVTVGDDVVALLPQLDAVMVVIQQDRTRRADLRRTLDLLEGKEIIGTVLNRSSEVMQRYGDYY